MNVTILKEDDINPTDIVGGRGEVFYQREGNQKLRAFVLLFVENYNQAPKGKKDAIVTEAIHLVESNGGRFLKYVTKNDKFWKEMKYKKPNNYDKYWVEMNPQEKKRTVRSRFQDVNKPKKERGKKKKGRTEPMVQLTVHTTGAPLAEEMVVDNNGRTPATAPVEPLVRDDLSQPNCATFSNIDPDGPHMPGTRGNCREKPQYQELLAQEEGRSASHQEDPKMSSSWFFSSPLWKGFRDHLQQNCFARPAGNLWEFVPERFRAYCHVLGIGLPRLKFRNWTWCEYYACPRCTDIVWSWSMVRGFRCLICTGNTVVAKLYRTDSSKIAKNIDSKGYETDSFLVNTMGELESKGHLNHLLCSYKEEFQELIKSNPTRTLEGASPRIHACHILIKHKGNEKHKYSRRRYTAVTRSSEDAKKKIEEIKSSIHNSDDVETTFREQAELYSDCSSFECGGDLGFIEAEMMNPNVNFKNALCSLYPGQMSDVVETESGYHLILHSKVRENVVGCYSPREASLAVPV